MKNVLFYVVLLVSVGLIGCSTQQSARTPAPQKPVSAPETPQRKTEPALASPGRWFVSVPEFGSFTMRIPRDGTEIQEITGLKLNIRRLVVPTEPKETGWVTTGGEDRLSVTVRSMNGAEINPADRSFSITQEFGSLKMIIAGSFGPDGKSASGTWIVEDLSRTFSCTWKAKP